VLILIWHNNLDRSFFCFSATTDRQTDRQTDRRTDRILIVIERLHSMQRGKKLRERFSRPESREFRFK